MDTMIKVINAVAVTLLIAVCSVFPAALLGQYVPGVFDPSLKPIAVAAWISGLASWWVARTVTRKQQEAATEAAKQSGSHKSSPIGVGLTVAFLALAIGVVVALHFFGEDLLP